NSFTGLGSGTQAATLQTVAPGIAEALVATAMGLFAAIPAVIFYNRNADKLSRIESRFETFSDEFLSILERHARRQSRDPS
ncbi:MAG: MotA/TolQ/ExbB proton channel family protein, partial [Pseudomonadota bacterium]